jgi:hypothetical protein
MITFKNYLSEASVDSSPSYDAVDLNAAIKIFDTHCSDAKWMMKHDTPFYRGDAEAVSALYQHGSAVVDSTLTTRKSQNTSNYYTMIFDNHPDMTEYPKRSKSFISTTDKATAESYSSYHNSDNRPVVMIPFNGTKIGVVNEPDMWRVNIFDLFGNFDTGVGIRINKVNYVFGEIKSLRHRPWSDWINFDRELRDGEQNSLGEFAKAFNNTDTPAFDWLKEHTDWTDNFLKNVFDAYDPEVLGFNVGTTKSLAGLNFQSNTEVWIGGKCLVMKLDIWEQLRKQYNAAKI